MAQARRLRWREEETTGDGAPDETSDAELAARAVREPAAAAALWDRHVDAVYRYCLARLGDAAEAEDATSVVFARALAALPRYRPGERAWSFRAWLFVIAHNTVANHHRDRRPERRLDEALAVVDLGPSPEEAAVAAEEARALHAALAALPEERRRAVELRLAGLSGSEIATVLGRSQAAVKML